MDKEIKLNKIKGLLREHEMTQKDFALLVLEIDPITFNNKLNGKTQFKANELAKIAEHFHKDIDYFF